MKSSMDGAFPTIQPLGVRDVSSGLLKSPGLLKGLYLLVGAVPFVLAWLPLETIVHRFLYEDFFYYLGVARHIVQGHGATADGLAPTNGFHALWMLICVAAEALAGAQMAIPLVLTVGAALHALQAFLVFRLVRGPAGAAVAHGAALFWLINYRVMACNLCGLETPLAVAALLASLLYLQTAWPVRSATGRAYGLLPAVRLGALLGLAILSRFDLALWAAAALLGVAFWLSPEVPLRRRLLEATVAGVVVCLCLVPWLAFSQHHSGAVLPHSQEALQVWAFPRLPHPMTAGALAAFLKQQLFGGSWWFTDAANVFGLWPWAGAERAPLGPKLAGKVGLLLVAVVFAATVAALVRSRRDVHARWRVLLVLYAWAHLGYYALFARWEVRYLMPFCAVTVAVVASALGAGLEPSSPRTRPWATAALFVIGLCASVSAWRGHQGATRTHEGHAVLLRGARWIAANLPPDAVLGGWNTGITSYFSGHTVVNLDGVINDEAIPALKTRTLATYIAKRGIGYLVDGEGAITQFMDGYGGDPTWRTRARTVHEDDSLRVVQLMPAREASGKASGAASHAASAAAEPGHTDGERPHEP